MAGEDGGKVGIGRVYVPLILVLGFVLVFGTTIVTALDREASVKEGISQNANDLKIVKSNISRIEGDVVACQIEMRRNDRVLIGIEKKLEYVVETVREIKKDVKDHKRADRVPYRGSGPD